jgi:hypothetical protein
MAFTFGMYYTISIMHVSGFTIALYRAGKPRKKYDHPALREFLWIT